MKSISKPVLLDTRKVMHEHVTIRVQYKGFFWVKVGLWLIRLGCRISGANIVEEFPMSLIQNGKPVDMNEK